MLWLGLMAAGLLQGQSESALRDHFEGRKVTVRMDMPGTSDGIDIYMDRARTVDHRKVGDRIKRFGISVRDGEIVTVTKIHLKAKIIEFHLNGGGYGTFGDRLAAPSVPSTTVAKSSRERDLESRRDREKDPQRKRSIERELSSVQSARHREERKRRELHLQAEMAKREYERVQRPMSGSRFNLHFDEGYSIESATPENIEEALRPYVEFAAMRGRVKQALELRKGMSEREVAQMFGEAESRQSRQVEGVEIVDAVYRTPDQVVNVRFADGVLTRYTIGNR